MDFFESWMYLKQHAMYKGRFEESLDIAVVKVDSHHRINDDASKNTETAVWLETGPIEYGSPSHDYRLDCGAPTFEKAIIKLAKNVQFWYDKRGKNKT